MFHTDSEEYLRGLSVGLSVRWCDGVQVRLHCILEQGILCRFGCRRCG